MTKYNDNVSSTLRVISTFCTLKWLIQHESVLSEGVTLPDQNAVFIACCSTTTTHPDNTATIEDLARSTTVNKEWIGVIHLIALSNVLNSPITSVYLDVHYAVRPLYNATFNPTHTDVCEQIGIHVIDILPKPCRCTLLLRISDLWTTCKQHQKKKIWAINIDKLLQQTIKMTQNQRIRLHTNPSVAGETMRSTSEENDTGGVTQSTHFTASSAEDASSRTTHDVEGTPGERTPTMIMIWANSFCLHRHVKM